MVQGFADARGNLGQAGVVEPQLAKGAEAADDLQRGEDQQVAAQVQRLQVAQRPQLLAQILQAVVMQEASVVAMGATRVAGLIVGRAR